MLPSNRNQTESSGFWNASVPVVRFFHLRLWYRRTFLRWLCHSQALSWRSDLLAYSKNWFGGLLFCSLVEWMIFDVVNCATVVWFGTQMTAIRTPRLGACTCNRRASEQPRARAPGPRRRHGSASGERHINENDVCQWCGSEFVQLTATSCETDHRLASVNTPRDQKQIAVQWPSQEHITRE